MGVILTWTDPNSGGRQEEEIRVYRATAPFDATTLPAVLATLAADTLTYDDTTALPGVSYWYAVAAEKAGQLAISFTGEVVAYIPVAEPTPSAAMEAEYLAADEFIHDWANLTGWTTANVQVASNRLYGVNGTNPSAAYHPFAIGATESARITCEFVRITGVARSVYIGFECVGTIPASLPNFCGIGTDGSSNFEVFIGANFTGVTTGATDVLARSNTGGTFTVTCSVDEDYVSLVVRSADSDEEGSITFPRSSLPGDGSIAGITVWNTDTRGTSGSYIKGIGVKRSLTPFRTKTTTGAVLEGNSGQVIHRGPSGDVWRIHLPKVMDGETAHPICLFTHQASTGDRNSPWDEARARPVLEALCDAGYIIVSADDQGDRWGNGASLTNYAAAIQWVRDNFFAGPVVLWSPSMGGAPGLNLILNRVLHVRAIAAICPVCDIPAMYSGGFVTTLNAAYGVTDLPGLEAAVVGFNPLDGDMFEFTGKGVRFWVATGTSDTVVPEADHAVLLQAALAAFAEESTIVEIGSGHLASSQYDAAAIVTFFDSYT